MNLTLRQLRAFVLVTRLGSFTRAAQAMHLTQSALSVLIRGLETEVGARLLDRTTRSITLTVAGSEFFPDAQRILADLDRAVDKVDELTAKERGRVVVAAPLVLSSTYLPPYLATFRSRYPGIELSLNDTLPAHVLPMVRSGMADVGIGTFPASERDLERVLLFTESMVVVFPAVHPFGSRKRIRWRDLAKEPVVALRRGSVFRDLAETGFASAGLTLTPDFEVEYAGTAIGLVAAGLGVAILPGYAMRLTDASRIGWRRIVDPVIDREVALIRRLDRTQSAAVQAFVEFLTAPPSRHRGSPHR